MAKTLIAEDDNCVRSFVARALRMDCHEVVETCDGEEGASVLNRDPNAFDLLLSDIRMPALDGIALAHPASRRRPGMSVVLMTGFADQRERASELEGIVTDVILKPFKLAEIRAHVGAALASA